MIITDTFVYIHQPKTGGTFVETVVRRLLPYRKPPGRIGRRVPVLLCRVPAGGHLSILKHGSCRQIPRAFRGRPILFTVRNPFDRYVSEYEFGWWRRYPEWWGRSLPVLRSCCPEFPDLSFSQYVRAVNRFKQPAVVRDWEDAPGFQTCDFVWYLGRNPDRTLLRLMRGEGARAIRETMYPASFLRTEELNQQLHDCLLTLGFAPQKLEFVLALPRIQPPEGTARRARPWREYYTQELWAYVARKERALLELFPEYEAAWAP